MKGGAWNFPFRRRKRYIDELDMAKHIERNLRWLRHLWLFTCMPFACVIPRTALGSDDLLLGLSYDATPPTLDSNHLPHARGASEACEHAFAGEVAPPQANSSACVLATRSPASPRMARVGAASPLEIAGGLNLYGFFDGAPTDVVDPLGLAVDGGNPHANAAKGAWVPPSEATSKVPSSWGSAAPNKKGVGGQMARSTEPGQWGAH
jgi:hypothetical protein